MGIFTISEDEVQRLGKEAELADQLRTAELIAVSAMKADALNPRFFAIRDTLLASSAAGVPHLVMLSNASIPEAADMIRAAGGIAVVIDQETQGGLARPFVLAAQLINAFAPREAIMVKFEGEKALFAGKEGLRNSKNLREAFRGGADIVTGVRSDATWQTMPQFQVATEAPLGSTIGTILGISKDTPSGVIALSERGRRLFDEYTPVQNDWRYLIELPFYAPRRQLRTCEVEVTFTYHPFVVTEETNNPGFDKKRLDQMDVMLDGALALLADDALRPEDKVALRYLRIQRRALANLAMPEPAVCPI